MRDHLSWISHLFRAFYAEGVRHVIISPGSRSTPLVLAAAIHPGFQKHVVLDERAAAFQALGIAKATGCPALLLCTSGTATANYFPAVIEARESGIPMIVISADRPPHMRGTGSSQTIDQIKLFGNSVLLFHELGEPVHSEDDISRLKLLAVQAVTASVETGGPVHINAPFRKPLEPLPGSLNEESLRNRNQTGEAKHSPALTQSEAPLAPPEQMMQMLNKARRPVIIAGPDEEYRSLDKVICQLSGELNIPVIAEPGSHADNSKNSIQRYDILLYSKELYESIKPDLIIKAGDQTFGRAVREFESRNRSAPLLRLLSRNIPQEETRSKYHRIPIINNTLDLSKCTRKSEDWLGRWLQLNREADQLLARKLSGSKALTDGHVLKYFSKILLNNWRVMSSNSFTIRDLSLFCDRSFPAGNTYVNRGAAGIDGIISTGTGLVRGKREKTVVFTGDLAMLHDSNSLLSLKNIEQPMVIIILNNRGGNIFRMLPVYNESHYYTRYFETPQGADFSHLARGHHLPYRLVDSLDELQKVREDDLNTGGPLIIECRTVPDASMELRRSLWNSNPKSSS